MANKKHIFSIIWNFACLFAICYYAYDIREFFHNAAFIHVVMFFVIFSYPFEQYVRRIIDAADKIYKHD